MSFWESYKNSSASPWGLADMFNYDDPSEAANKYNNQIPKVGHDSYDPYINRGKKAGDVLDSESDDMMHPTEFMDAIMKHYKTSAGAQYQTDKLGRGIGSTAAAGGIAGTPEHQRAYGEMASDIGSKDMQTYLENALGIHRDAMGVKKGINDQGYDATKELTDLLGGNLNTQGTMAYGGAQQKNMNRQALMNAIMKALGSAAGAGA